MNNTENRLTLKEKFLKNKRWYGVFSCSCDGKIITIRLDHFASGHTRSCGCLKTESDKIKLSQKTHGLAKTPEFKVWCTMRARCNNPNSEKFPSYGARGIIVCERWNKFENFIADMGKRPSKDHSIERKDNNGNYCPENCIWATRVEQANNKRSNLRLTLNGVTKSAKEWAKETGIPYKTIHQRKKRGWSDEDTLVVLLKAERPKPT